MTATLTQYIAVNGQYEPDWTERTYGRHSDTRYLDEPTVPVWFLLLRENYRPTETSRSARRAA
jgi:hypothetical protein